MSARELYLQKIKTPEHRQKRQRLAQPLIDKRRQNAASQIPKVAAQSGHDLCMLPSGIGRAQGRQWSFTCRVCTRTRGFLKGMSSRCLGLSGCIKAWQGNRLSWWIDLRRAASPPQAALDQLITCKATALELQALENRVPGDAQVLRSFAY